MTTYSREAIFQLRKAEGIEAARWLQPEVSRAASAGKKTLEVKIEDLQDMLRYVQSQEVRDSNEFFGKKLGYAREVDMRAVLGGSATGLCIIAVAGAQFNVEVTYRALPAPSADRIQ